MNALYRYFSNRKLTTQGRLLMGSSALLLSVLGLIWACVVYLLPSPPKSVTFAAGPKGGAFEATAQRYAQGMRVHGVAAQLIYTRGMTENLELLSSADAQADVSVVFGGLASKEERAHLLSVGRVSVFPIWFFHRIQETGAPVQGLASFRGKRIAIGPASRAFIEPLLAQYGINGANSEFHYIAGDMAAVALQNGEVDVAPLPFEFDSPAVQTLLRVPGIGLANMKEADALVRLFPYLAKLVLPRGVVDLQSITPPEDMTLVGISNAVVVRPELHSEIVFRLARVLAEEHGRPGIFNQTGEFPSQADPEFKFADSALDFYRNGVPALNTYLPFWVQRHAKRMLAFALAVLGILWPAWQLLSKSYEKLIDARLRKLLIMIECSTAKLDVVESLAEAEVIESEVQSGMRLLERIPIGYRYTSMHESLLMRLENFHRRMTAARIRF